MTVLEIVRRYTAEDENSTLSCGGNISFLDLQLGEKVLDLGCGRGEETLQAATLVGGDGFAWGLDITPKMIERAQDRADQVSIKNVGFILSSMEEIPIGEESLDAVLSNCAINHVEDKVAVYREIHRTLKSGGRFVVSDIMTETPLPSEIKQDPEAVASCFGGAITVKEYEEVLVSAGFDKIEILKERHYVKNGYKMISRTFKGRKL
ncbi:MAG: hypothetical protein APF81_15880 [Desulfosporosinus sp. BRH_c37]|nr:MAG: hypothetical protein APF81_15880 [Desulfosporosinus sp. BRH_c37]